MAVNADLYLSEQPRVAPHGKRVSITPATSAGSSAPSSQDVAEALAMMTQNLLLSMQKMMQFLALEAQENAETTQDNVSMESNEATKAVAAMNAKPSFLSEFLNIALKIIGPVLAVLALVATIWFAGPAAFAISALILCATMIPIHNGQGLISLGVDASIGGIGNACGWSPGAIQLVEGIVNFAVGIALAIASGFATAGLTAVTTAEVAGTAVAEVAEDAAAPAAKVAQDAGQAASKFQASAGRLVGFTTLGSTLGTSNCFNDMFAGAWAITNNANDQEKGKEFAAYFSLIMNLVVTIISGAGSISAMSGLAANAESLSPTLQSAAKLFGEDSAFTKLMSSISSALSKGSGVTGITAVQLQSWTTGLTTGLTLTASGLGGLNGWEEHRAAELEASITQLKGALSYSQGLGSMLGQMTSMTNASLTDALKKFDALEKAPNYSQALFSEAQEMLQANQQA